MGGKPHAVGRTFFQPLLPPESGSLYFFLIFEIIIDVTNEPLPPNPPFPLKTEIILTAMQ